MPKKKLKNTDKPVTQSQLESVIEAIREVGDTLMRAFLGLEQKVGGLEGKVGSLEGKIGGLEGKVGSLEGKIGGLEGKVGSLEGKIGGLEGKVGSLEGKIGGLEKEFHSFRLEQNQNWKEQRQFNKEISQKVDMNTASVQALDGRIRYQDDMPERLDHVESQQYELTRRVTALEKRP